MPIITISRGSLSGGELLAEKLGQRLGYKVISRDIIVEAAKKYGVSEARLFEGMQSPPGFWDRFVGHKDQFILAVQATLAELIEQGNAVYHGYAGQLLLKDLPCVIKLRLIAPVEYRIQAAMLGGQTREQAIRHIESVDQQRARWVRQIYNVEWTDPSLYDLVLNLNTITMDAAVDMVAELASREEYKCTPDTAQALKDFALEVRVRAALALQSGLPDEAAEVKVIKGVVHLSGGQYFERNRRSLARFVKQVPGVEKLIPDEDEDLADTAAPDHPHEKSARDIMVAINGYPHLHESVTIREAIAALGASTVKLTDGHLVTPRYVLVLDQGGHLVGVVSRRDLLRGLTPQLRTLEAARDRIEAVAPFASTSIPMTFRWVSLFGPAALSNSWDPVKTVMAPIRGTVKVDDGLSAVVTTMIQHAIDLVPVMDGDKAVGVVLMTDVFDSVAQYIMEKGVRPPSQVAPSR